MLEPIHTLEIKAVTCYGRKGHLYKYINLRVFFIRKIKLGDGLGERDSWCNW